MAETTLTIQTADGPMQAHLATPDAADERPGLLVLQEAFGVNHHIKNVCRRLAERGFVALAPELFHRTGTGVELGYTDMSQVMPHFSKLTNAGLETDIKAGLAALAQQPQVDAARLGVIGFCVGGFATFLAAETTDSRTFVAFYGGGILRARPNIALEPLIDNADRIRQPILLLFGGQDQSIPPEDVTAIDEKLTTLGKPHRVVVLPEGGHGFACDERSAYHQPSADYAWKTTFEWLGEHL
jgi:carboxymethylenebutenolidase